MDEDNRPHLFSWSQVNRCAPIPAISENEPAPARPVGERWPEAPRLTDEERERVHVLIDELADEYDARRLAHEQSLALTAKNLGRQVSRGRLNVDDALRRINALIDAVTPDALVPVPLVPYRVAQKIANEAFAEGLHRAK